MQSHHLAIVAALWLSACGTTETGVDDDPTTADTTDPGIPQTAEEWAEAYANAGVSADVADANARAVEAHPDGEGLCCYRQLFRAWSAPDCADAAEADPFGVHPLTQAELEAGVCTVDICLAASLDCYYRGDRVGVGSCLYYDANCACLQAWSECYELERPSSCDEADACVAAREG